MQFDGFRRPKANFYRLPNDWFDIWQQIRRQTGQVRILGALKAVEYVIKWTWGYGNFADPVHLSWSDFQEGRRTKNGWRHDKGTGLSRPALSGALTLAVQVGLLEKSGSAYLPRLMPPEQDRDGFLEGDEKFNGFASPEANYFVVPAIWTDLSAGCSSEATILVVEYMFRHTWGWRGGWNEPCWMTEEEIATGRRKRSGDQYDNGTGYSVRAIHDAVNEAVRQGWLVWRWSETNKREYALHLQGMIVSDDGEFLGWTGKQKEISAAPVTGDHHVVPSGIHAPQIATMEQQAIAPAANGRDQRIAALEQQVRRLTVLLSGLLQVLESAGFEVNFQAQEESLPVSEEGLPLPEENLPVSEESLPPCNTDTFSDNYKKTPATANNNSAIAEPTAVAIAAAVAFPEDLQQKLAMVGFRGAKPMQELLDAYQRDPDRIRWWVEHLATTRAGDPRAGGFLLQTVVREEAPVPPAVLPSATVSLEAESKQCPFCGGHGFVRADVMPGHPLYGQQIPCPRCSRGSLATS